MDYPGRGNVIIQQDSDYNVQRRGIPSVIVLIMVNNLQQTSHQLLQDYVIQEV
jgi:hypothetical protein